MPLPGHYASVIRIDERTGIALSTDGVGTKLLVAEQLGRFDTVGIDCVAMNVNDVICVGAEPLAMLDYIAVPTRRPGASAEQIGVGLRRGAELAGIEIPGGELAQLGEPRQRRRPRRRLLRHRRARRDRRRRRVEPGRPVIGLPSSGLHSNGYTLARTALDGLPLDEDPRPARAAARRGAARADRDLRAARSLELLRSEVDVRGLAHITSGGLGNLLRLAAEVGYEIDDPLPVPPIFELIARARRRLRRGDARGLQHGLRLLRASSRPSDEERRPVAAAASTIPAAKRVGIAVEGAGVSRG